MINYRTRQEQAEDTAREVRGLGTDVLTVQADVRDDRGVRAMIAAVVERFGRLDVLVNNAGITHWIPFGDLEALGDEIWHEILDVNVLGPFRCARAAAPMLREARGAIVNVSSITGVLALETTSSIAYSASKAAMISLTRSLAVALAPEVRVNAVAPSFADTPWMQDHFGAAYLERVAAAAQTFPLRRIADPEDVARAIFALVTGGDYVTGQTLMVDGGRSIV